MIPIKIDIRDLINEFSLKGRQIDILKSNLLDVVVANYVDIWEHKVMSELHSTKRQYLDAIYVNRLNEFTTIVGLNPKSKLALMVEGGTSPFDMKNGFKNSKNVKYNSKGKWYLTVPFRHATPDAIGESEIFSGKLPREIYDLAKSNYKSGIVRGLIKQELPLEFQKNGSNPTTGYNHKNSIFEGLKRVESSSTKKENRGMYVTFRRVSEKSDKGSWVHKGFVARNLMEKSLNSMDIPTIVDNVTNNFLADI